jgi:hypothetical protein
MDTEQPLSKPASLGAVTSDEWKKITNYMRDKYLDGDGVKNDNGDSVDEKKRGRPRDKEKAKREERARSETISLVNICPGLYTSVWSLFQICSTMREKDRVDVLEEWCMLWCNIRRLPRCSNIDNDDETIKSLFGNPLYRMVKEICVDNPRREDSKTGFFSYQMKQFTFQVLELMVLMEAISSAVAEVVDGSRSIPFCTRILSCKRQFVSWLHGESGPGKRHGDILYCGDESDVNARRVIMDGLYFHHKQRTEIESKKAGIAYVTRKDKTPRQLNADEHMLRPHLAWSARCPIVTRLVDGGSTVFIECGGIVLRCERPSENLPHGVDFTSCRYIVGQSLGPYERGKIKKVSVGRIKTILFGAEYPECLLPPLNPSMNDSYGADGPGMLRWKRILNRRGSYAMKQAIRVSKRNRMELADASPPSGTWGMFESPEVVETIDAGQLNESDVQRAHVIHPAALHPIHKDREFYGYAQLLYKKKLGIVTEFCLRMCQVNVCDDAMLLEMGLSELNVMLSAQLRTENIDDVAISLLSMSPPVGRSTSAENEVMADVYACALLMSGMPLSAASQKVVHERNQASSHHFTALQMVYFQMLDSLEPESCHRPCMQEWKKLASVEITLGHGLYISYGGDIRTHKAVYEYLKLPWLPNPEENEPDNLDRRGYSWVGVGKKKKRYRHGGSCEESIIPASSMPVGLLHCGVCSKLAVAPVQWASHAVVCLSCVWGKCVGWVGMDFESPPRQKLTTNLLDHTRGLHVETYTPELGFLHRCRPGVWLANGLSTTFLSPATLANQLIQEQVELLSGTDALTYEARRIVPDIVEESINSVWDEANDLTIENNSGHWHATYTDGSQTPQCRMWHQSPDSNIVLRRTCDNGNADVVWQPENAHDMMHAMQKDDVKAYIQRSTGASDMFKLCDKTALDIWDAWAHNPAAETEYARQLGIPPFSLSHLMVTFALVKNSGMEQMIMDEWTRNTGDAIFDDTGTSFSFASILRSKSHVGSLPTILRQSCAGSINSGFEALVNQIGGLP